MFKVENPYQGVLGSRSIASLANTQNHYGFSQVLRSQIQAPDSMESMFEKASQKYQVPVNLLKAVGKAESDFDANAVSHCGASGVMQLMPQTAKSLGVTDVFNAEQNIMGGAKYLSQLLDRYDGDVKLTLAAYNAGSGNVAKYGGIPPFKETQNYVEKVMKYAGEEITIQEKNGVKKEAGLYPEIYNEILNFKEYTQEDYRLFAELLRLRLLSSLDAEQTSNQLLDRIQTLY